jgi:predicted transcriptional regulator
MTETPAPAPGSDVAPAGKRPARGYSWPPFEDGNVAGLRHGGYSAARIGERAELVAREVLELAPGLAADEFSLAVTSYAMARARVELLSAAIEKMVATLGLPGTVKLGPRIVEAATAASREEAAQRRTLGLDPLSMAELRNLSSLTDLNQALLNRLVPELPAAIREALDAVGAGEAVDQFTAVFVAVLRRGGEEQE